jgi:RNA polymerase sigma-70 factor (ECF subfamily)
MNCTDQDLSIDLSCKERAALRDEQLVSAAQAGSSVAFAELQRLYSRHLYSTIVSITKNREDAEDALQDTFLRAYLALRNFEGRSSFYSWLTRIAINSALMLLRKRRVRPEVSFEPANETEDDALPFEIRDTAANPEQIYDQHQRCAGVLHAIQKLEPSLRRAIQIRMEHGCSLKEIARTLEISEAAVKTRLHRARVRLTGAKGFRNVKVKRLVSSASRRDGLIPGLQNREQPCIHCN